jgi:hypothetical protein
VCTAELNGRLFMVACDVEQFLRDDYGVGWPVPFHDSTFVWCVRARARAGHTVAAQVQIAE